MYKADAEEAVPIVNTTIDTILNWLPSHGTGGADARHACGQIKAHCLQWLAADVIGPPLLRVFELARRAGMTLVQMDDVRLRTAQLGASSVGAIVVRDACIELALSEMGRIIADTVYVSRGDVEETKARINAAFLDIEEEVADHMDSMTYRALIGLHAAIIAHLVQTARPLPQMLTFRFARSWPTLVLSHKLYADASRADELRRENRVVHPAFALPYGRGLSG